MLFRLIICALASTFLLSCTDRKREEETAALLDHVEDQLGTLHVQQAELYDTADFLERQGATLRNRSDELALALADIVCALALADIDRALALAVVVITLQKKRNWSLHHCQSFDTN